MNGPSQGSLDFAIRVERRRCADIARKSAALYRELAAVQSSEFARRLNLASAEAAETLANDIEDA